MVNNACCVLVDSLTYQRLEVQQTLFGAGEKRWGGGGGGGGAVWCAWDKGKKKLQVYEQSELCVGCFVDFRYSFHCNVWLENECCPKCIKHVAFYILNS